MYVRMPGRVPIALALAVTGILASGALPTPAQAAATVNYVALGDSYSSGTGAGSYDSSGCTRSSKAYAPLWAAAHSPASFRFVACSGAVTADVRNNQLSALDSDTTLVTITIGGNDAGFAEVVITCQLLSDSACADAVSDSTAFVNNTLPARLDQTYAAIRSRAPNAKLMVLGYPRLFELSSGCGLLGMSLAKRKTVNAGADVLAGVIAARARAAGATFVDSRSAFSGHGVCASGAWINGVTPLTGAYHPNAKGHASGYLSALTSAIG